MLTSAEHIHVVADAIKQYNVPFSIVDPVCCWRGSSLLDAS